jgi:HSP20 family protein
MAMIKFEPFKDLTSIREQLNHMLEESIIKMVHCKSTIGCTWNPPADIYELDNEIVVTVELPGINQKDITLEMKDDVLILKGERKLTENVKEEDYKRMERLFGKFERTFPLSYAVDLNNIKAEYKNGVLTVSLPKKKAYSNKKINVG